MIEYTTKEIAQHCLNYTIPVCNVHHKDRIEVLTHLAALIKIELNVNAASDPDRNR